MASSPRLNRALGTPVFLGLLGALVLTFLAYRPGLDGPFVFDDYNNIVYNDTLRIDRLTVRDLYDAVMSGTAGPLKRPLTMATFAVNHALTGIAPYWFKLTNLVIHLLNGCLVFLFCRRLLELGLHESNQRSPRNDFIALAAAALWVAHPVQLTSVLYVVQRMTSLSATFVLAGLLAYLKARTAMMRGRTSRGLLWLAVPFCTMLAILAKENGVLLPLFAFVIEASLLRFRGDERARWGSLNQFYTLTLVIPLLACVTFLALNPQWVDKPRDFSIIERLLTEMRVLWMYIKILFVPAISDLALYYDNFSISRSLLQPATTAAALAGLVVTIGSASALRTRYPWYAFAVFWFLAAHALESTFIMLEPVHPHRNYVAYLGPVLAICVGAARAFADGRRWIPAVAAVVAVGVALSVTGQRSMQWGDAIRQVAWEVHHQPDSPRANYELGRVYYLVNLQQPGEATKSMAGRYFRRAAELEPRGISALIGLLILDSNPLGPTATQAMMELRQRLARHPLMPRDVVYIKSVVTCISRDNCAVPPQGMIEIFGAILSNERLSMRVKPDVLAMLGMYYANVLGDMPACVRVMREAVLLQPEDVNHRLNLVRALMMQQDYVGATRELEMADRLDRFGAHRGRANEYRSDLAQLIARRNALTSG